MEKPLGSGRKGCWLWVSHSEKCLPCSAVKDEHNSLVALVWFPHPPPRGGGMSQWNSQSFSPETWWHSHSKYTTNCLWNPTEVTQAFEVKTLSSSFNIVLAVPYLPLEAQAGAHFITAGIYLILLQKIMLFSSAGSIFLVPLSVSPLNYYSLSYFSLNTLNYWIFGMPLLS